MFIIVIIIFLLCCLGCLVIFWESVYKLYRKVFGGEKDGGEPAPELVK
jgi:hypothetical protein